jgi:hypothetical protein
MYKCHVQFCKSGVFLSTLTTYGKKFYTKFKEKAFLTLQEKKIVIYENDFNKSIFYLPPNTVLFTKPGRKVFDKQIIAQKLDSSLEQDLVDPNLIELREIKSRISGQIYMVEKIGKNAIQMFWVLNAIVVNRFSFLDCLFNKLYCKINHINFGINVKNKKHLYNNQEKYFKTKFPKLSITIRSIFSIIDKSKRMKNERPLILTTKFEEQGVLIFRKLKKK